MEKKHNILIITELYPNKRYPYLGSFVYSQVQYLKKYYNITLIVPRYFGFKLFFKTKNIGDDITIYNLRQPILLLSILRRLFNIKKNKISSLDKYFINKKIYKLAKKINNQQKIDLIIGQESGIGDEACFLGRKLKIPSIFHLHGLFDYHKKSFGNFKIKEILFNINTATEIISVSNIAINSYKKNGLFNKNINIIPNILIKGTDEMPLDKHWQEIIKNKIVIISVSWLVKEKRIDNIITLANSLKNYKNLVFLIIGEGDERTNYQKLINKYNLQKMVYLVGPVDPKKISSFYKNSSFLIHPSIVDSFSMVCLEAMSHHKPIICTKNIGLTEFIKNSEEGFIINPDDKSQLLETTLKLVNNENLRIKMGEQAFETSKNFYSDIVGEKIKNIYERTITSKFK